MGKLVVVENDKVEGTDKHNLSGPGVTPTSAPATYVGVGSFDYTGKMTDALSEFVNIDGQPVALKSSRSSLNPGETAPPIGKHSGPAVKSPAPPLAGPPVAATVPSLQITDPVGEGKPSAISGSRFVNVEGTPLLLDADKIDTCDGFSVPMNSTVTAQKQDFVQCSE